METSLSDRRRERYRQTRRILWIILLLNAAVAAAKLAWGYWTNSLGMIADGFHSTFDGASNVIGLVAIAAARHPPDWNHPYGHRKFENLAAMGISVMLFFAAYHIFREAVGRWQNLEETSVTTVSFAIMIGTMFVNYGISRYETKAGKQLSSPILTADAAHTRSDIYASFSVIVGLAGVKFGFTWLDPVAGGCIALYIVYVGILVGRQSLAVVTDEVALESDKIRETVNGFSEVEKCWEVRSRGWEDQIFVDMKIEVPGKMSVKESHNLCDRIEEALQSRFPEIRDVVIHVEPG